MTFVSCYSQLWCQKKVHQVFTGEWKEKNKEDSQLFKISIKSLSKIQECFFILTSFFFASFAECILSPWFFFLVCELKNFMNNSLFYLLTVLWIFFLLLETFFSYSVLDSDLHKKGFSFSHRTEQKQWTNLDFSNKSLFCIQKK